MHLIIGLLLAFPAAPDRAPESGVAIIAHRDVTAASISIEDLRNLYGLVTTDVGDRRAVVYEFRLDSPVRQRFYLAIGRNPEKMRGLWMRARLTGRATPPTPVSSEDDMLASVETTPGGIGYVSSSKVRPGVKVLLLLP
jgi:hypothetical protein